MSVTTLEGTRNGPWPRISQSNTWTCAWRWWTEQPVPSSNYKAVERMTADRNGSRLSPTPSFAMLAVTCAWTAAAPGWVGSPWRSAARASASSGSSPSICSHRGGFRSSPRVGTWLNTPTDSEDQMGRWTLEGKTKNGLLYPSHCTPEVQLVLSMHLSPSSTLQREEKNTGGGACRPQWRKWEIIWWIGGYRDDREDKSDDEAFHPNYIPQCFSLMVIDGLNDEWNLWSFLLMAGYAELWRFYFMIILFYYKSTFWFLLVILYRWLQDLISLLRVSQGDKFVHLRVAQLQRLWGFFSWGLGAGRLE